MAIRARSAADIDHPVAGLQVAQFDHVPAELGAHGPEIAWDLRAERPRRDRRPAETHPGVLGQATNGLRHLSGPWSEVGPQSGGVGNETQPFT